MQADERVRAAAAAAGYTPDIINTDVLPSPLIRLGLTGTPDSFLILHRVALFANSKAEKAYLRNPGMTVFRVTPKQQGTPDPFDVPDLRVKGTGSTSELDLLNTEEELGQAILAKYNYLKPRDLQPSVAFEAGYDAIQRGTDALGDNRDTIYLRTANFFLRERPDDFVIAYGAKHMATGKLLMPTSPFTAALLLMVWRGRQHAFRDGGRGVPSGQSPREILLRLQNRASLRSRRQLAVRRGADWPGGGRDSDIPAGAYRISGLPGTFHQSGANVRRSAL